MRGKIKVQPTNSQAMSNQETELGYIPSVDCPNDIAADIEVIKAMILDIQHPPRIHRVSAYKQDLKDYLGAISSYGAEYKKAVWGQLDPARQKIIRDVLSGN